MKKLNKTSFAGAQALSRTEMKKVVGGSMFPELSYETLEYINCVATAINHPDSVVGEILLDLCNGKR